MKSSKARLDWREGRRRRAWELKEAGWKQAAIAAALGVTSGAVSQWLTRARAEGVEEGLRAHPAPGPTPKLTPEHIAQLPPLPAPGPKPHAFRPPARPRNPSAAPFPPPLPSPLHPPP